MGEIPAVLASLDPTVVATLEAEPGWAWMRCETCGELRYHRRATKPTKCSITPRCPGVMKIHLGLDCQVCAKTVTARRRGADTRFCSKRCEGAS